MDWANVNVRRKFRGSWQKGLTTNIILLYNHNMITVHEDTQREIAAEFEREHIEYSFGISEEPMIVYTYTVAEERLAKRIVREWDCHLAVYMPGDKELDKAWEWELVAK